MENIEKSKKKKSTSIGSPIVTHPKICKEVRVQNLTPTVLFSASAHTLYTRA